MSSVGLDEFDLRTRVGRQARHLHDSLVQRVGGRPSVMQSVLIEQAVSIHRRLASLAPDTSEDAGEFLKLAAAQQRIVDMLTGSGTTGDAA